MITSVGACEKCGAVVRIVSNEGSIDNASEHDDWHAANEARQARLEERLTALEQRTAFGL